MDKHTAAKLASVMAEAVQELGSCPSGHLYAHCMAHMSLTQYDILLGVLKRLNLITEQNHVLTWIGDPAEKAEKA
jgi:hypothetical protein